MPAACLLIIALAVAWVRLPLYVERPLQPLELGANLRVGDRSGAELEGSYLVSLVGRHRASVATAVDALLRDTHRLRGVGEVLPAGVGEGGRDEPPGEGLAGSLDDAGAAALAALGRSVPRRTGGVRVVDVVAGSPADGRLRLHDVILSINAEATTAPADVRAAVDDAHGRVRVVVERGGDQRTVRLHPGAFAAGGEQRQGLGVMTVPASPRVALPMDLELDAGGVTGPSAGLMIAVAITDLLDDDHVLTGGRRVAGTGRIDLSGRVASVSGVPTKVRGAVAAGAELFLVPESQRAQAQRAAAGRLTVVGVRTLEEAVQALRRGRGVPAGLGW